MSLIVAKTSQQARLKPEIRLAQAVSQFKSCLSNDEKLAFDTTTSDALNNAPDPTDVLKFTAQLSWRKDRRRGSRCYGPRFTNFLTGVQQFAALGDVVVGGSQNIIACSVWSLVRMSLLATVNVSSYVDRISLLFMEIGRTIPRNQTIALLYRRSKSLQAYLCEYFIVVVRLCHHIMKFAQASLLRKMASALIESDLEDFQTELNDWSMQIKDELLLQSSISTENEAQENMKHRRSWRKSNQADLRERQMALHIRNLDHCSKYDFQTTWKQLRKLGTTQLFKNSLAYNEWATAGKSSTLIFTGKLGCGKSVMMANIVEHLIIDIKQETDVVAYFFCQDDLPEGLRTDTIIGSLTRQLLHPWPDVPALSQMTAQSQIEAQSLLEKLLPELPDSTKLYLVVDGLDNCTDAVQVEVTSWVRQLQKSRCIHLCMSSRSHPQMMTVPILQDYHDARVTPMPKNALDINTFIDAELESCLSDEQLRLHDPSLVVDIREALIKGSQGMFLWVALQIKSLCAMQSDGEIREALQHLPEGLSETYEDILRKRNKITKATLAKYQRRIFELIIAARRPLTIYEIEEALSIVPGTATPDIAQSLNNIYATLSCCGCLVVVDEEELTVRLVHPSLRQFLVEQYESPVGSCFTVAHAHRTMAEHIVTYLSYAAFRGEVTTNRIPEMNIATAPSRIVASTLTSKTGRALALRFLKSAKQPQTDVTKTLANALEAHRRSLKREFHLHQYAKKYYMQHIARVFEPGPHISKLLPELLNSSILSHDDGNSLFSTLVALENVEMCKIVYTSFKIRHELLRVLKSAIKEDNVETIRALFKSQIIDYDFKFDWAKHDHNEGPLLLAHAASLGSLDIVAFILNGTAIGVHQKQLHDTVSLAIEMDDPSMLQSLIKAGELGYAYQMPWKLEKEPKILLKHAVACNSRRVTALILENNPMGSYSAFCQALKSGLEGMAMLIWTDGEHITSETLRYSTTNPRETPLWLALQSGCTGVVTRLIFRMNMSDQELLQYTDLAKELCDTDEDRSKLDLLEGLRYKQRL
ncbi:unnamed protein product [Periconia digitata]|uniref:NACHT domain-containing protein n=1 Tax=Periconia digitata TaxID=1303443 RepID=A0A9W4UD67_9PLEO|nr:unnamed protein product [Periconia digitata]